MTLTVRRRPTPLLALTLVLAGATVVLIGPLGVLCTVMERKLSAHLRSLTQSTWRYLFGPLAVAAGLVAWGARDRMASVTRVMPALAWGLPGLVALTVLGYAANDSGIAVPGAMPAAFTPGVAVLLWCARTVEPAP